MTSVEVITSSTQETGELYLLIDDEPFLVPEDQDRANRGSILVYPEFEDDENVRITPAFPKFVENDDVFIYWYTFYYLMREAVAPSKVERYYLKLSS